MVRDLSADYGKTFAKEAPIDGRGFRGELHRRTGYWCGVRSIGRVLRRLHHEGLVGRERVLPGRRMVTGIETVCGGQHNWIITRDERRKAERAKREAERQARHAREREAAKVEREEAEKRAREESKASAPRTAIALLLGPGSLGGAITPDEREAFASHVAGDDARGENPRRVSRRDQLDQLKALQAAWDAEERARGRPPPDT